MASEYTDRQELERYAGVLVVQADRLIRQLDVDVEVDVSKAKTSAGYSPAFHQVDNAYERLASAMKRVGPVAWERTMVDGRNGDELMDRLWKVRDSIRQEDRASG